MSTSSSTPSAANTAPFATHIAPRRHRHLAHLASPAEAALARPPNRSAYAAAFTVVEPDHGAPKEITELIETGRTTGKIVVRVVQ
ncbi:hypothetical protein ACIBU0_33855 [Streptomyces sp. NPDC049627]|uniref:hypothetical protein n=1 Tax=Streptomyces sp. NPDC049627 TaxID=3365595 RepID=UPI003792FF97